jgi:hypothetical protein
MAETVKEEKMEPTDQKEDDLELEAIRAVYSALRELDVAAQNRVLDYVMRRLNLRRETFDSISSNSTRASKIPDETPETSFGQESEPIFEGGEDLEGISPVAQKWMKRNGLAASQLSSLYSLGVDEIDLVASSVPGKSIKKKMRNVLLLKGVGSYLGSGAARISDEKLREACGHYGAYDTANFSKHINSLAAEVSGTKESGYTLTSRGMTEATKLIKQLIAG